MSAADSSLVLAGLLFVVLVYLIARCAASDAIGGGASPARPLVEGLGLAPSIQTIAEERDGLRVETNGTELFWRYGDREPTYLKRGRGVVEVRRRRGSTVVDLTVRSSGGIAASRQTFSTTFDWSPRLYR